MKRHRSGIGDSTDTLDQTRLIEDEKVKKVVKPKVSNKITFELEKTTLTCFSIVLGLFVMSAIVYAGMLANIFDYNFEYEDYGIGITPDILVLYEQYDRNGDHFLDLNEFGPLADRILNSKVMIRIKKLTPDIQYFLDRRTSI
jgi:hypothetical protein